MTQHICAGCGNQITEQYMPLSFFGWWFHNFTCYAIWTQRGKK